LEVEHLNYGKENTNKLNDRVKQISMKIQSQTIATYLTIGLFLPNEKHKSSQFRDIRGKCAIIVYLAPLLINLPF
jgi:hypothetical protein